MTSLHIVAEVGKLQVPSKGNLSQSSFVNFPDLQVSGQQRLMSLPQVLQYFGLYLWDSSQPFDQSQAFHASLIQVSLSFGWQVS